MWSLAGQQSLMLGNLPKNSPGPPAPRPAHITSWPGLRASAGDNRGDRGGPGPRNNKEARSDSRARRQWCAFAPFSWLPWTFSTIGSWILLATSPLISWTNYFNEKGGHSLKYGNGTGRGTGLLYYGSEWYKNSKFSLHHVPWQTCKQHKTDENKQTDMFFWRVGI